jgi:shikimate dehydrogenase
VTSTAEEPRRRAAVLGKPIAHSLSPQLHTAAYRELGLAHWRFDRIECDVDAFPGLVHGAGPEWVGWSLTMPLKRVAIEMADEVSPLARAVGAANTLLFAAGVRRVENTDVAGIVCALREAGVTTVESALILGAGGTAQAALAALRELGHLTPTVLVRDLSRTTDLQAAAHRLGMEPRLTAGLQVDTELPAAHLVISTLPPGAADRLRFGQLAEPEFVLDIGYDPWPTPLASVASGRGALAIGGLSVLLHQAVLQVELMTGLPGPVDVMRAALARAIAARGVRTEGTQRGGEQPVEG